MSLMFSIFCSCLCPGLVLPCLLLLIRNNERANDFIPQLPAVLDEADEAGDMALDLALLGRQHSIADTLLKHGASVTTTDPNGASLLHRAVRRGQVLLWFISVP